MTRNVRLSWIADAEARRFEESVLIQHHLSEPTVGMVLAETEIPQRHWVRRLMARLALGSKFAELPPARAWPPDGGPR
jgi:hypothetical protein